MTGDVAGAPLAGTSGDTPVDSSGGWPAQLAEALRRGAERQAPMALLVVATLGLGAVHGVHGRRLAGAARAEIRARLTRFEADDVVVVPLEGGDVALVCPGRDETDALALAEHVLDLVGAPTSSDPPVHLMADVGVAVSPHSAAGAEDLARDADTALSAAATHGPGSVELYRPGMHELLADQLRTAVELSQALATDAGLFLHYQPVFDLATDGIVGAEALVRWNHPSRGLVSPGSFIPIAEETGLITDLGRWVLEAATAQLSVWQALIGDGFRLHVNLSPGEFQQPRFVDHVAEDLDRHEVAPGNLLLEITETALMTSGDTTAGLLDDLRAVGVWLGIDDFGTGYSSISYLRDLPVDMVKLDRSLTSLVASSPDEYALTRAIFGLLRSSGLETVAEGIEEPVQVAHLRALRCRYGQGFLLGRPAGPELVTSLLQSRNS